MHMLTIEIAALKPGKNELELRPDASEVDLDPGLFSNIRVNVTLHRQVGRILVHVTARAFARLECDRTLVMFEHPIEGSYTVLFAPPEMADQIQENFDDLRVLYPTDQEIDLTETTRETILLAVPMRKIAPGAEETELKLSFGNEDNIDPRWDALRGLAAEGDTE